MLILAFDTSATAGSVALLDGCRLLAERSLDPSRRLAQTLAPAIAELLASQQLQPAAIRLVATTVGPGSFTGLRIGVTTAKVFAYAIGAEVLGLSTLEVIAQQAMRVEPGAAELLRIAARDGEIQAVLDARRRELFVGRFKLLGPPAAGSDLAELERMELDHIVPVEQWLSSLGPQTLVSGAGLERVKGGLPEGVAMAERSLWEPQAATVGRLAWRDYQRGRRDDVWRLTPVYLRPSYAEEKAKRQVPPGAVGTLA